MWCTGGNAGDVYVTLSHEVGGLSLLERENAAALNAALRPMAARTLPGMRAALAEAKLGARLFLTANDGTLMSVETAQRVQSPTC